MGVLEIEDKIKLNPFYKKAVYLLGDFLIGKEKLENKLKIAGACECEEITEACVVVVGYNQPLSDVRKLAKCKLWDGLELLTITEDQACEISSIQKSAERGEVYWDRVFDSFPQKRDIDITYDSLFNRIYSPIVCFADDIDSPILDGKKVFMLNVEDKGEVRNESLKQLLEKAGATVTDTFDPNNVDYCLLRESTIEKLKKGEKDRFIRAIEETYNKSGCSKFPCQFLFKKEMRKTSKFKNITNGYVDPVEKLFEETNWKK